MPFPRGTGPPCSQVLEGGKDVHSYPKSPKRCWRMLKTLNDAVSARKILCPSPATIKPWAWAEETSSWENPPSGPIKRVIPCEGSILPRTSRREVGSSSQRISYVPSLWRKNSSSSRTVSTWGTTVLPHCLAASWAILRHLCTRSDSLSPSKSRTERDVTRGTIT